MNPSKVVYHVGGRTMAARDAALIGEEEDPLEELVEAAIGTIATEVEITVGGITMHLAAWRDPEHWEEDWRRHGMTADEVAGFVAENVEAYVPE